MILIRHGKTRLNEEKRYAGWTDCRLSEEGKKQAEKVALRLRREDVHSVYASDLRRAFEFAKIIFKDIPVEESRDLREMNFGIFEGMNHEEIMKKVPGSYDRWLADPYAVRIPDGESFKDLTTRVRRFLKKIEAAGKNKTIAIVTHAGPLKVILGDIMKPDSFWDICVDNAAVSIIECRKGKKRIMRFNDTSFL